MVQKVSHQYDGGVHPVDFCEYWDVVRTVCHSCHLTASGFLAVELGVLQPDVGGHFNICWYNGIFHDPFPIVRAVPAVDRDC